MSFILDALKKSESERQRQGGPALFEVKVAPPRHRIAPWVALLAVLLAINLGVVGWLLARSHAAPSSVRLAEAAIPAATAPSAAAGVQPASRNAAPSVAPAETSRAGPEGADAVDANPADYEPAVEPSQGAAVPDAGGSVVRESSDGLPTYEAAAAAPGADLPSLRLDLHVYSPQPAERFVFLNMVKLREGQSLPQGVRVDRITPDGVILSYHGERFQMQRR